jgi:hypothetical protein
MPRRQQLSMQAITGRSCFVTEMQSGVTLLQSRDHTAHGRGIGIDLSEEPHFPLSAIPGQRHGMPCLGHIESNENCCILSHGSSSRAAARLAQCEQPSFTRAVWDESPHSWTDIQSYDCGTDQRLKQRISAWLIDCIELAVFQILDRAKR